MKLTKDDFTRGEDGDYNAGAHWITIHSWSWRTSVSAHVYSSDWCDEDAGRGTSVDSESGFATVDDALAWAIDRVNEIPLRLACIALEIAFAHMAEWLPFAVPAIDAARAEGAAEERERTLAAIAELIAQEQRVSGAARRNAETARRCNNQFGTERFEERERGAEACVDTLNRLVVRIRTRGTPRAESLSRDIFSGGGSLPVSGKDGVK